MRVIRRLAITVLLAVPIGWVLATAANASTTYGPAWGRFHADFSAKPKESTNISKDFTYFGLTSAFAYAETSNQHPFDGSAALTAPTFEVVTLHFGESATAKNAVMTLKQGYVGSKQVTVGGGKGFESMSRVNGPPIKTKKTQEPRSKVEHLGVLVVARGSTVYQVVAEASRGFSVTQFVGSFSPG